jgi:hypothetical protein
MTITISDMMSKTLETIREMASVQETIQKVLQKDMASEVGISSSSSVHFEDGLESS